MGAPIEPPPDRYCDLVMKGGITSGLVYPGAIARLSATYRFKNIGGTSAGAIAAAVTAAAEYRRRKTNGSREGFKLLEGLPGELKAPVPRFPHLFGFLYKWVPKNWKAAVFRSRSRLLSLFQPQPKARRLFTVLELALNSGGTFRRIGRLIVGFLFAYWPATAASMALAGMVWSARHDALTTGLTLLVALVVSIGMWCYRDITRNVVGNGFGLCKGKTEEGTPALTAWLHEKIQAAAGLDAEGDPLTFGDLWTAGKDPGEKPDPDDPRMSREIDLQMFSTNLTHGRPYVFPLTVRSREATRFPAHERLYFKEEELKPYLPQNVMTWMTTHGKSHCEGVRELPKPAEFPVLLAARMSLSFPFLISAVPLYAIDPRSEELRKCWFSDGGISSNFPMHLFDGLVPRWPTFGINLEPARGDDDKVYLPLIYEEGYDERWNTFFERKTTGKGRKTNAGLLGGFIGAIVSAMQNWNDNMLTRMPGVRDRVARVPLLPTEGGMNLNMKEDIIQSVAEKGMDAAKLLEKRFGPVNGRQAEGWDVHRLVRLETLLKMLEARAGAVSKGLSDGCPHTTDFDTLIDGAATASSEPAGHETKLTGDQVRALKKVKGALKEFMDLLAEPANTGAFKAIPAPELRVRPPL